MANGQTSMSLLHEKEDTIPVVKRIWKTEDGAILMELVCPEDFTYKDIVLLPGGGKQSKWYRVGTKVKGQKF